MSFKEQDHLNCAIQGFGLKLRHGTYILTLQVASVMLHGMWVFSGNDTVVIGSVVRLSVFLCLKWWEVCFFEERWSDDQALIKLFFLLWVTIQIVASFWKCWNIYEKCRDDKNSWLCYRSVTGYAPLAGTVFFFLFKKVFNNWIYYIEHDMF